MESALSPTESWELSKTLAFLEALATADVVGAHCPVCGATAIRMPRCECRSCGVVALPVFLASDDEPDEREDPPCCGGCTRCLGVASYSGF